jgi:hypothetical protein
MLGTARKTAQPQYPVEHKLQFLRFWNLKPHTNVYTENKDKKYPNGIETTCLKHSHFRSLPLKSA